MTKRPSQALALAILLIAMPAVASDELQRQEPDTIIFAMMSGKCRTLKVAGRDLHLPGRSFLPDRGRQGEFYGRDQRSQGRQPYHHVFRRQRAKARSQRIRTADRPDAAEIQGRPKADGLPVPSIEPAAGICKQVGNFVTLELSSISCTATDKNGKKYELQYESDGTPMAVRRIKRMRVGSPAVSPFDN